MYYVLDNTETTLTKASLAVYSCERLLRKTVK